MIHFWNRVFLLSKEDLKYRRLLHDTLKDTLPLSIENYYFPYGTPNLGLLDRALSHRNTTVPSDEALCIATLMNLDIDRVLGMSGEDRMVQIWDLITEKNKGGFPCKAQRYKRGAFDGSLPLCFYLLSASTMFRPALLDRMKPARQH